MGFSKIMYFLLVNMVLLLQSFMTVNILMSFVQPITGSRLLVEDINNIDNKGLVRRKDDGPASFSGWNITGTYRGSWRLINSTYSSSRFSDTAKDGGIFMFDLISTPTEQDVEDSIGGVLSFIHVFNNEREAQFRVKGVYAWPDKYLQVEFNSEKDAGYKDDYIMLHPYHLLGAYASQVFQESSMERISPFYNMKDCNVEIRAQVSKDEDRDGYNMEGIMESDDNGECSLLMLLNATSIEIENYSMKAIKYTLMVTFIGLLEIYLAYLQMGHSGLQDRAANVSILTICHQAIMDTYICLFHLVAGYLVDPLLDGFIVAVIFKFVLFSLLEMKYVLAIWYANRPNNDGHSSAAFTEEVSAFHGHFYMILVGGIFIMLMLHKFLPLILLILHSFWIPQIVTNVVRNTRKPLHPYYIFGMSTTRLSIPLYIFGCPHNFIHAKTQMSWCICLAVFMSLQTTILLVQNYFGSRCFLPDQLFRPKYSYYRRCSRYAGDDAECVICMSAIDISQRCSSNYMVTPCNHLFHYSCLEGWMDVKMECPICRRPLPVP